MGLTFLALTVLSLANANADDIQFKKLVLDTRFISEGVAAGDVNRDGKLDVLAGNVWYQAPDWKRHEIAPVKDVDPKQAWSNCFHCWAADLNKDGWIDQIVIGMPGEKAIWRENPKGKSGPWKEHLIWRSAGNESPLYEDLFGNGKKVLIMGYDDAHLAWFEPAADPYSEWTCHNVSELKGAGSQRYSHGLGVGDLDEDGRKEILTTQGYYKGTRKGPWIFVKADLGPDCAQMLSLGPKKGILTTSAHARGVWWFEPDPERDAPGASGRNARAPGMDVSFNKHVIDETISVTHAANLALLGKPKTLNLITGKRQWAHPPGVDVGSEEPAWLVRYELDRTSESLKWTRHIIDEDSGVGTQFVAQDMNRDGLHDIVVSNKNGVFLFAQLPS
jgi:hypothetical protein